MKGKVAACALTATLLASGCGLTPANQEESVDRYAAGAYEAIHIVQRRAKALYDAGTIESDRLRDILEATVGLTDFVAEVEAASDLGGDVAVGCASINLGEDEAAVCNREDVTRVLTQIKESLE